MSILAFIVFGLIVGLIARAVMPGRQSMQEILRAVHDVLLLLDYYSGHEWALTFVREPTKSQLGVA